MINIFCSLKSYIERITIAMMLFKSYSFFFAADPLNPDYRTENQMVNIGDGLNHVCGEFGSLDDNTDPILEDVEFYQILLTSDDNAVVAENRSIANIFIEDNDGWYLQLIECVGCYYF